MPSQSSRIRRSSKCLDSRVEAARVAADDHLGRDRVAGAVGDDLGAGDDRGVGRVDVAGDDGLQPQHDLGARPRAGRRPSAAGRRDRRGRRCGSRSCPRWTSGRADPGAASARRPGPACCGARTSPRPGTARRDRRRSSPSRPARAPRPAGRRAHRAVEAALAASTWPAAEHHGHVPVVAAGVHRPVVPRSVRQRAALGQRQPVHVGAQPDRPAVAARRAAPRTVATRPVPPMPRVTSRPIADSSAAR